jgi:vancomycin resistance protein YoaR
MKIKLTEVLLRRRAVIITLLSVIVVALLFVAVMTVSTLAYADKMYPGITVGGQPIAGLTENEARAILHQRIDAILDEGLVMTVEDETETIPFRFISPDDPDLSQDLAIVHVDEVIDSAFEIGHTGNILQRSGDFLTTIYSPKTYQIRVELNEESIETELLNRFERFYDPAIEPKFDITRNEDNEWRVEIIEGESGRSFDLNEALTKTKQALSNANMAKISVPVVDRDPQMSLEDVERIVPDVLGSLAMAPYELKYDDGRWDTFTYSISDDDLAKMLQPSYLENDGWSGAVIEGNEELDSFMQSIAEDMNIEARDARFRMSGNRVQEFRPSKEGREVDLLQTRRNLLTEVIDRYAYCNFPHAGSDEADCENLEPIEIIVTTTEPEISTDEVNDLGIREILGVGVSDFSGSPSNRIKNIRHGASKLDGILIAPDEEFSLIAALKPFTIADGYLAELVIKGDEIKPEVGGGLCQIGTTTFRAVMNSGLGVTQRRNHSLVVSYYNDPSNDNPGTDATIYDPAPDFKFLNDTGHHILLTTYVDASSGTLRFTFWGTNDGRNGYYSAPVVHNWIGAGATQTTYTTDLAPGVRKCQGAHNGANTSFTYTVEQANGEVNQTVYESHYRPLPRICLEGVEADRLNEDGELIPLQEEAATEIIPDTTEPVLETIE